VALAVALDTRLPIELVTLPNALVALAKSLVSPEAMLDRSLPRLASLVREEAAEAIWDATLVITAALLVSDPMAVATLETALAASLRSELRSCAWTGAVVRRRGRRGRMTDEKRIVVCCDGAEMRVRTVVSSCCELRGSRDEAAFRVRWFSKDCDAKVNVKEIE
jgi:hypothetical protein